MSAKRTERSLFDRIVEADKKGAPLRLRPGDVMQLCNFFADLEITRASLFDNHSAYGHRKRFPLGRRETRKRDQAKSFPTDELRKVTYARPRTAGSEKSI